MGIGDESISGIFARHELRGGLVSTKAFANWSAEKYAAYNCCIYCGSSRNLSDEHIIPYGLQPKGGDWFLPKASCDRCADVTKKFEGLCLQATLGPLRAKLSLKTRRRPKRTTNLTINYRDDGRIETTQVPLENFPMVCLGFRWKAAGLLRNVEPATEFVGEELVRYPAGEMERFLKDGEAIKIGRVGPSDYARMLAKIAHCYAVAKFGQLSFDACLPDVILGTNQYLPYFIGGDESGAPLDSQPKVLHDVYPQACDISGVPYLLIGIRLFAFMGMPRYLIVAGKMRGESLAYLRGF